MKLATAALTLTACLLGTTAANAYIAGPYTADSFTLHLWHLDEAHTPCIDSVSTNGTNLVDLAGGATLGNASYSTGTNSFGTALNTAAGGGSKGDLLAASPTAGLVTLTIADTNTGAFTMEALVQVGFDPTASSTSGYEIMAGENGGNNAGRIFQWRIAPKGFALIAGVVAAGPCMTFENVRSVSGNQNTIYAPIPTTGPDAIIQGNWYHVAVTYSGVPSTAGNLKFYWTAMNPTNAADDQLTITSVVTSLTGLNPLATVTTTFMLGNQGRSINGNFLGSIDEVRISRVARPPGGMMFATPTVSISPMANQFVAAGATVTLTGVATGLSPITYQWQYNGSNITLTNGTNISDPTFPVLTITNATFAQAGAYTLVANNSVSTNSVSAVVNVGTAISGLHNTGTTAGGALLPGGSIDPNWTLAASADPNYPGPNALVDSTIPGTYAPNGPNSEWIAPGDSVNNIGGIYQYQTRFVLDSQNISNMQLVVNWAADNFCQNIILNGVDLNIVDGNGFTGLGPTILTNNFVIGSNSLICVVSNTTAAGLNLTAFRAELSGLSAPLPPTAIQVLNAPANVTAAQFQSATFAATIFGSGPLSYQWYFGATPLTGQTSRTLTLNNLDPSQAGVYNLIVANSLSTNTLSATLTVVVPDTLEWRGLQTGDWDLSTPNWMDLNTSTAVAFSQNVSALFDDNGASQPNVSLDVPLSPNAVTVTGSTSYLMYGNGYLTGTMNLVVSNTGTLTLDTANNFTGNTIIQAGTLQVGNSDANGWLGSSAISNNGTLNFARTDVVNLPNNISGSGQISMIGSGNLVLTGSNTNFTGAITVANGVITPRTTSALGSGASNVTVLDNAEVYIDQNISFPTVPFLLGGTGPNSTGALRKGGAGASFLGGPITLSDYAAIALDASSSLFLTNPAAVTGPNIPFAIQVANAAVCTIAGDVNLAGGSVTIYGVSGNGTVILTSTNNNWTGGTSVGTSATPTNCTLQIGDGGPDGSLPPGPVNVYGTLTFNTSNSFTLNSQISGSGIFNQSGAGRMLLSGAPLGGFSGSIRMNGNGQLQLAPGESLSSGTLTIGSGQADSNRVELTGNNTVSLPISIFPRAFSGTLTPTTPPTNYPDIINLSGTNTVNPSSPVTINSGGNLFALQSDSGNLIYNAGVLATGASRNLSLSGAGTGEIDGTLGQTNTGSSLNVWELGPGRWTLNGQNSYTGTTIVSNGTLVVNGTILGSPVTASGGTLGGIGTLTGPVVIASGATLAPTLATGAGTPINTLTVSNSLTLQAASTTSMQINKTAGTSDRITGITTASFGGTLAVNNISGALAAGDSFQLFSASNYTGSFSGITPASPGAGLRWNSGGLAIGGLLRVTTSNIPPTSVTSTVVSGGNIVLNGIGGALGGTYVLLTSTNLATPVTNWTQVRSGVFDGSGTFSITNTVPVASPTFYVIKSQ